jgi:uncharacterized membrane protein YdfJ with MMPL/SSD domain
MFEALGKLIYRRRWWTLLLAGVFLTGSVLMLLRGGALTSGTFHGIESDRAQRLVADVLGHPVETTFLVILRASKLEPASDAFRSAVRRTLDPLRHDSRVLSVAAPADVPSQQAASMVNAQAHEVVAYVTLAGELKTALQSYPAVREQLHSDVLDITCTGYVPFVDNLNHTLAHDLERAEYVSFPLALLVLLAVFGTAVAATLPVGVGGLAVAGGIAIVLGLSHRFEIAQYTVNVCSLIGMGVAIDYSLFIVSRYREELAAGLSYPDALARALSTAGRVVAFSGVAVGTGLVGLLFFRGSYLLPMGVGGAIVVTLAIVFALTFLPALLAVLGPLIHAGRLPTARLHLTEGLWHRMATWVMRRPLRVLVPTLAALLAMGVPFFHLRMATADVRVLDTTVEARRGYEELRAAFPEQAMTRILVTVRFPAAPALTMPRIGALFDLSRRLAAIPRVTKVESIVDLDPSLGKASYKLSLIHPQAEDAPLIDLAKRQFVGERVVLMYALTDLAPDTDGARSLVRTIRSERQVGDGTLLVGGETAQDVDATAYILQRAPRAIGFIVGVTLVILFLLFGSIVLPIKAVVMNFVSIAGSFGAIVWIFQDGHLFVHRPLPLDPSLPVLLFCVLFGLSMDYEVLMLSRIKESYDRTGDNTHAVAEGLERTAGLITSAALIMVAVFSAFALAKVVLLQAVGFGMALAVALDATLVRVLLVPATMRLFGHLNWWAPQWLLRLRARVMVGRRRE